MCGFKSPCLKAFVVARINPVRFHKGEPPSFDALLEKMLGRARHFNVEKVREQDIGPSGGPPEETEG